MPDPDDALYPTSQRDRIDVRERASMIPGQGERDLRATEQDIRSTGKEAMRAKGIGDRSMVVLLKLAGRDARRKRRDLKQGLRVGKAVDRYYGARSKR